MILLSLFPLSNFTNLRAKLDKEATEEERLSEIHGAVLVPIRNSTIFVAIVVTRRHPTSRNRPICRPISSSNFGAGGRDSSASRRSRRRPDEGRAGRSRDACVSCWRRRWRRRPRRRHRWKHRIWTKRRRRRRKTRRKRKPADRYARQPATATSSTVVCRDDGRLPPRSTTTWRDDDRSSSCSST